MSELFYLSFAPLVQVAIAFDFGLLYIYKNKRTIFKSVQIAVSDAFRKNHYVKKLLEFSANVPKISVKHVFMKKWNAIMVVFRTKMKAALDVERTCDYLAVLGIISGIYSLCWLLLFPYITLQAPNFPDLYITLTTCTAVACFLMLLRVIFMEKMSRTKAFILSVLFLILCCGVGCFLYKHNLRVTCPMSFKCFFMVSMMVVFSPVCVYVFHVVMSIVFRAVILVVLSLSAIVYKVVSLFLK